jgi:hypothetical protein
LATVSVAAHAADPTAPPRVAVVIANASYPARPSLPQCVASGKAMSAALRQAGFEVMEVDDASNADIGGRLGALPAKLHPGAQSSPSDTVPRGAVILYACGYASGFDGRSYLVPIDVPIEQPSDLLAQGVLLNSLRGMPVGTGAEVGLVLLDLIQAPGETALPGLDALGTAPSPTTGVAVAIAPAHPAEHAGAGSASPVATPLANAAAAALSTPRPEVGAVISAIQEKVAANAGRLVIGAPTAIGWLDPTSPPPAALAAATTPGSATPPPAAPATTPPAGPPTAPPAGPPTAPPAANDPTTPPEVARPMADVTTDTGRRSVQTDLQRLGYYAGSVDGIFGPDSRAAIRRLQHELGDSLTGRLTPAEIMQLQARAR